MARTPKVHRLTAVAVKRYMEDASSVSPLHDGGGLYLRKRDASARWYLRLTEPSTRIEQWHRLFPDDPLGIYPHKNLAAARAEAKRLWELRSTGIDPRAQRTKQIREQRAADEATSLAASRRLTVRAVFAQWVATDLQPRIRADGKRVGRKDGGKFTQEQFDRRVFPKIGGMTIEAVKKADLLAILDSVKGEGKLRTANVLLADLKQMLRFALTRDLIQRNPLDTVAKRDVGGASVERERVLSQAELVALAKAIPQSGLSTHSATAAWLILATGVRVGELMGAVWVGAKVPESTLKKCAEDGDVKLGVVDLEARTWHMHDTKNQREHNVHLSDFAIAQFKRLAAHRREHKNDKAKQTPWVFPNAAYSGPVSVKTFGKQLSDRQRPDERRHENRSKATTALVLTGGRWTAHDLRRTAATLMAGLGVSGDVIDECLNHVIESRVRRTYIRDRRTAEQATAFDALGALMTTLTCQPEL